MNHFAMRPSNKPLVKPSLSPRIIAHDRRLAAIHEAGHIAMARHLGVEVIGAGIEKNYDGDVRFRQWIGHTAMDLNNLSREKKVMLAIAGAVAEYCWSNAPFADTVEAWEEPHVMSESDWAATGCAPGNPSPKLLATIEEAFWLFDRDTKILWPELIKGARRLITTARSLRSSDGKVLALTSAERAERAAQLAQGRLRQRG